MALSYHDKEVAHALGTEKIYPKIGLACYQGFRGIIALPGKESINFFIQIQYKKCGHELK